MNRRIKSQGTITFREEIARDRLNDDLTYDAESPEPMTEQDIEDWT